VSGRTIRYDNHIDFSRSTPHRLCTPAIVARRPHLLDRCWRGRRRAAGNWALADAAAVMLVLGVRQLAALRRR
jgi:hypothetical protein